MRAAPTKLKKQKFDIRELLSSVLVALLIAIFIRSFVFEPFRIPSASMYPTLQNGDILVVNKFAYGYSRHSLPWSIPLIPGRILYTEPKRGDVIVIKLPEHPKRFFIKRLIGLPGDKIKLNKGVLYINNKPIPRKYLGNVEAEIKDKSLEYTKYITVYNETLPGGFNYNTWSLESVRDSSQFPSTTGEYVVPKGHFFFMGDNRDDSADSRDINSLGFINGNNLLGKASFIIFSLHNLKRWFIGL